MTEVLAGLRFAPLVPVSAIVALAVVCAGVAGLALWRRARGGVLRLVGFAVVLLYLSGPTLVRETRQALADVALMVVDQSASMGVGKRAALAAEAARALKDQAAHVPNLELRQVLVPEHGDSGTALWTETQRALADIPANRLSGIVAITDGQVHDLPAAAPPGAPLHVLIPARGEEWDRRVRIIEAPSYGIVGRTLTLKVAVEDLGRPQSGTAPLTVRRDGSAAETLQVPVGETQDIPVDLSRAGRTVLEFSTDPVPGEASPLNNRATVEINGVRDRLRVLLVSGEPNLDERTWRRLLKSDPAVDLVHFTILRPPERDDLTPLNELALIPFPTRELFQDKLSSFDLIILDRFTDRGILPGEYLENIANYVHGGGALLLTAGPEFAAAGSLDQTPLSSVLPAHMASGTDAVIDGQFRPEVTPLGARHPVTAGLAGANAAGGAPSWGPWYRLIGAEDVQGQVLMTGADGRPLLVLNHVDDGRVAILLSDQIWLWSRGHMGGGPQAELLRRVAHWLMGEPELDENRLTARIENQVLTVDRRTVQGDAAGVAHVTPPEGPERDLALRAAGPGAAEGAMPAALPGVWRVEMGGQRSFVAATQNNPLEFADLRATAEKMGPLARASGGQVDWLAATGTPRLIMVGPHETAGGPGWIGLRRRGAHLVTGVAGTPLFPIWLALPLLLGLVLAAWRREAL
jgi:hypothetical protein